VGEDRIAGVRQSLARARAEGREFDEAWSAALEGWPTQWSHVARAELAALEETRGDWERAYQGDPATNFARAAAALADA
jgi:hypothetical protein